tara:strand:+ start:1989 stop:2120 length:132 start_codon:yes stop_codon:yes gene_type:complete
MATTKINDMYEKSILAMAAYADGGTKANLEAIGFRGKRGRIYF